MSITLDLRPEIEEQLKEQARARGITIEDYIQDAVENLVSRPATGAALIAQWDQDGVLGAWSDRRDITDGVSFARELRRKAEARE
jgi:hypothetical protein